MGDSGYILFYSNRCLHSKEFLTILSKDSELNQKFNKINIDTGNVRIPPYVTSVPTAIITIEGKPNKLVGTQIFNWYKQIRAKKQETEVIQDWDPSTMTGYSDGFSYLENPTVMKKSFAFLTDNDSITTPDEGSYTGDGKGSGSSKDKPKTQLDSDFERMMSGRNNDVPTAPPRL